MRVWLAGGMVGVMRWMDVLVVGYYTVQITGSALITAQMLFLRMLPMFLLGAFCGAWAERFDRRSLLVTLMLSMTAMYSSLAGLAFIVVASFLWSLDTLIRYPLIYKGISALSIVAIEHFVLKLV